MAKKRPRRPGQSKTPDVTPEAPIPEGLTGRPRVTLTPEDYRQAETLAGYGLTNPQIANVLGLAARTFAERIHDDEELSASLDRGRAKAQAFVGEALFLLATGKTKLVRVVQADGSIATERVYTKAPDIQAIRWYEMTRAGRSEKIQAAVTRDETERPMEERVDEIAGIINLGRERARRARAG